MNRVNTASWNVMYVVLGVFIAISCVVLFQRIEPRAFPVVKSFQVSSVTADGDDIILSGTLNKVRGCDFIDLTAYTREKTEPPSALSPARLSIDDASGIGNRPAIEQTWGPWRVRMPQNVEAAEIALFARHRCTALWDTESRLADVSIIRDAEGVRLAQ